MNSRGISRFLARVIVPVGAIFALTAGFSPAAHAAATLTVEYSSTTATVRIAGGEDGSMWFLEANEAAGLTTGMFPEGGVVVLQCSAEGWLFETLVVTRLKLIDTSVDAAEEGITVVLEEPRCGQSETPAPTPTDQPTESSGPTQTPQPTASATPDNPTASPTPPTPDDTPTVDPSDADTAESEPAAPQSGSPTPSSQGPMVNTGGSLAAATSGTAAWLWFSIPGLLLIAAGCLVGLRRTNEQ